MILPRLSVIYLLYSHNGNNFNRGKRKYRESDG